MLVTLARVVLVEWLGQKIRLQGMMKEWFCLLDKMADGTMFDGVTL